MGRKAVSHVDFAIASGLFIMIFAFLVLFTTNYFSTMKNDATISEKRGFALNMLKDIMSDGEPANWQLYLATFGNNTAANWSREVSVSDNSTINQYSSGELLIAGDSNFISFSGGDPENTAYALEATFPYLGIPSDAVIGNPKFEILYNTSYFPSSSGEGDIIDDFSYFHTSSEVYLDDWGNGKTESQWIWWNSPEYINRLSSVTDANNMKIRIYFNPSYGKICYFDEVNFTVNYSYYPHYPRKIGLAADSYKIDVLLNNTIDDLSNERVTLNFDEIGFPDADINSVTVYNDTGSIMACNVSESVLTFSSQISNQTAKWFTIWFSKNTTSNFSSAACNSTIVGSDNLTAINRNESFFPAQKKRVVQYSKLSALNRSIYTIMKLLSDQKYDFHLSLKNLSGDIILEYGEDIPTKGDINALQRSIVYQNSSAGINNGFLYIYMW